MFHTKGPTFWELTVQALSSTTQGYDLLAPKFEYTPFRTPDLILQKVSDHLQTIGPFARGLDICCGTGAGMKMLRLHCTQQVVGIDLSGAAAAVSVVGARDDTLLAFLSTGCTTCQPFWDVFRHGAVMPDDTRLLVQSVHADGNEPLKK